MVQIEKRIKRGCHHTIRRKGDVVTSISVINVREKLSRITEQWSPKIVARLNDTHFKLVKFKGDFIWHRHQDTDEAFFVLNGEMHIDFRDTRKTLKQGELLVVPKGVAHKPHAEEECHIMLIEPAGTPNTGDVGGNRTVEEPEWI